MSAQEATRAGELPAEELDRLDRLDTTVAERTIPRGTSADDDSTTPSMDPAVWRDHVTYARTRDPRTLERLVEHHRAFALGLAKRMHRGSEPLDDLHQVALEALVRSIQRFEPQRGLPFASYATPTILGALRRHYRDTGWALRVPRRVHELAAAAQATRERIHAATGSPPTYDEVAADMEITVEALIAIEDAAYARNTMSLDAAVAEDGTALVELLGTEDNRLGSMIDHVALMTAARHLDERDRRLLVAYYVDERSQTEIAGELGVSQMQVSRLLAAARRRLRAYITP